MPTVAENNKRIAKNTLFLYGRTLFIMLISLYTSRVVLNVLGIDDFGIYNVVGGFVAMFALINGSLTTVTQRFLNFELGKKNNERLKQIFSISISIHFFLAIIILLLGETLGWWFLNTQMNIASERIVAANWVYQCSLITFLFNLISIPYNAAIIAHEKMNVFAYISILDASLKLGFVFLLQWVLFDKLITYAILMLLVAIIIRLIYSKYSSKHFQECSFVFCKDKALYMEMTSFAGWTFIGNSSIILKRQGINILLNIFCGVAVNAARGIAVQIESAVKSFVSNFMVAMNPQITKLYSSGNTKYMINLVQQGAKLSFYMLFLLSLPILIETEAVLRIVYKIVPEYTVVFLRLSLIYELQQILSTPLATCVQATGKVRNYQLIVGGIQALNFPLSWLFLYLGFEPQITYIVAIFLGCFCFVARLLISHKLIGLSVWHFTKHVLINAIIVASLSVVLPYLLYLNMDKSIVRLLLVSFVSVFSTLSVVLFVGCSKEERRFVYSKLESVKKRLK
jgi:O-antigen/teichoic acid export membrane protein